MSETMQEYRDRTRPRCRCCREWLECPICGASAIRGYSRKVAADILGEMSLPSGLHSIFIEGDEVVCDDCGNALVVRVDSTRGTASLDALTEIDPIYPEPPRDLSRVAVRTCPISGLESHR